MAREKYSLLAVSHTTLL